MAWYLESGQTQRKIATAASMRLARFNELVHGKTPMTRSEAERLARHLGRSVSDLYPPDNVARTPVPGAVDAGPAALAGRPPDAATAEAWAERSGVLAAWVDERLVNRRDCYGRYIAVEARRDPDITAFTAKSPLTPAVIARHFRAGSAGDLIGLHAVVRDETAGEGEVAPCRSLWLAADIDRHGDEGDPEVNWRAALALYDLAKSLGFDPLLFDSNGRGGFHLLIVFDAPVPTEKVYAFGQWLVRDWRKLGLAEPPETFPKQAHIGPGGFGNWLRLPGPHHTRPHFTLVWGGTEWLDGARAIDAILATRGATASAIPAEALRPATPKPRAERPRPVDCEGDAALANEALQFVRHMADGYRDWIRIGLCLTPLGDEGLSLWDAWSAGSPKYHEGDCERKWRSFRRGGGEGLSLGTLFYEAERHGWESPWRAPRNGTAPAAGRSRPGAAGGGEPGMNGRHDKAGGLVGSVGDPPQGRPEFEGPPRPLTAELLAVPPLPEELIPTPLRGWLKDIAWRGCFPLEYPTATAVVSISSLIGRRLTIRPKRQDAWMVVPNLWGAIVGPPGFQKTPAAEETMLPLRRLIAEAMERHAAAQNQALEDAAVAEAKAAAARKVLAEAAKKNTSDEELRELAAKAREAAVVRPAVLRRYIINDTTVEKLGELIRENPVGMLHFRDELTGFFCSMDRQGHESDRGFYLECWNGDGSYTFDRIGRGTVFIPALCLSMFGTIQPGPLARYLKGAAAGDDADGFMPRFQVLLYPDAPASFENHDRWPDAEFKNRAFEVFRWVDAMDPAALGADLDEDRGLRFLRFDGAAQDLFDGWRIDLENRLRGGSEGPLLTCHLSKYRSLMPSLALQYHVTASVGCTKLDPVSEDAARKAAAWCDLLEAHARRVYQFAAEGDPETAGRLAARLRESLPDPFTYRQVANKGWSGLDTVEDVRKAVGMLEDRNWVRVVVRPPAERGGRPSEEVWINPAVRGDNGVTRP
jgi:putative DNA primase/helicase